MSAITGKFRLALAALWASAVTAQGVVEYDALPYGASSPVSFGKRTADFEQNWLNPDWIFKRQTCASGYTCPSGSCASSATDRCCPDRGYCLSTEKCCLNGCVPYSAHCCSNGRYCVAGTHCCVVGGCCYDGDSCTSTYGRCVAGGGTGGTGGSGNTGVTPTSLTTRTTPVVTVAAVSRYYYYYYTW